MGRTSGAKCGSWKRVSAAMRGRCWRHVQEWSLINKIVQNGLQGHRAAVAVVEYDDAGKLHSAGLVDAAGVSVGCGGWMREVAPTGGNW